MHSPSKAEAGMPFLFSESVSREVSGGSRVPMVSMLSSRTEAQGQPGKYSKSSFGGRKKGKREGGKKGNAQRDILELCHVKIGFCASCVLHWDNP